MLLPTYSFQEKIFLMQIRQELIDRFFINECSSDEVDLVIKYFSENKSAFEKYMGKGEWDNMDNDKDLDKEQSKILLASLKKQLFNKRNAAGLTMNAIPFQAIMAAASLILLLVCGWWFMGKNNRAANTAAVINKEVRVAGNKPRLNWKLVRNTGKSSMVIKLEDGSVITLSKNTVVKYPVPFAFNNRTIELNGDAFFQVAKNKFKPFIVYTGNLSTTALGTSFRITAFNEGKLEVNVKLITGKVVVQSIHAMTNWKGDCFLLPGDLLRYNAHTAAVFVTRFSPRNEAIAYVSRKSQKKAPAVELRFNNTALNEVMKSIASLHHIKISYSEADIQDMNFTGTVNEYDDVAVILKMIARMNELQVDQTPEGFKISGSQKQ